MRSDHPVFFTRFFTHIAISCTCAIIASCAAPGSNELVQQVTPNVPPERLQEARIAALIGDPSDRRAMRQADDIEEWLDEFWRRRDPTPSTAVNEIVEVYKQRAAYMESKFPELISSGWSEQSVLFLQLGVPDWQGPEFVPWPRPNEEGYDRTLPTAPGSYQWERLTYSTPFEFTLVVEEGSVRKDPNLFNYTDPPSLEGVWDTLENPGATAEQKRQALTRISWYELPDVAERLLNVPPENLSDVDDHYRETLHHLTLRSSYTLESKSIRRLAALIAAGAPPELNLRRAISGEYSAEALTLDLFPLSGRRFILARMPNRGPHPNLWRNPEELLEMLVELFPAPHTLTGWDWRGDLYLAMGAPTFLDMRNRTAHYLWGTPENLGIGDTMLGRVDVVRLYDPLQDFIQEAIRTIQMRRMNADEAASTLSSVLSNSTSGGGSTQITNSMLDQLHVLAPPAVYSISVPREVRPIPITTDIVAFPASGDSVEIQATFGIPAISVKMREERDFLITDLRTNLLLVSHELKAIHAESRQQGYVIRAEGGVQGRFFLDTYRFKVPYGSYIAYLSAEDPNSEASGGVVMSVDLVPFATSKLQVSPILLASSIEPTEEEGKFVRGGELILPAPARRFLYGQDLFFYFEVSNLTASDTGGYSCSESLFIIPNDTNEGIITVSPAQDITSLEPSMSRSMGIDLSSLGRTYEGGVFLVILITDQVSGEQAVGATWLSLRHPQETEDRPPPPGSTSNIPLLEPEERK